MRVRPFELSDWELIKDPVEPMSATAGDVSILEQGYGITITDEDKVAGCGGILPQQDGTYYVWLRLNSEQIKGHRKAMEALSIIQECFKIIMDSFECEELYSFVLDDFSKGKRFAEFMGFDICGFQEIDGKKYRMVRYNKEWE